jgi:hypothetical protein
MEAITLEYAEQIVEQLSLEDQKQLVAYVETRWQAQPESIGTAPPRRPGSAVGKFFILTEDDEHLADFKEYLV